MTTLRLEPDALQDLAGRYSRLVTRVAGAREELLAVLARCEPGLSGEPAAALAALRAGAASGLEVLVHDHRQLQVGLAAVAGSVRELDHALLR